MNSVVEKYFSRKKSELIDYTNELMQMFCYNIDILIDNKNQVIKRVLSIYFEKYYKATKVNYDLALKYFKLNDETDSDFKAITQCTIEYYEGENIDVVKSNIEILYLSYMLYFAILIDRLRDTIVMTSDKYNFIVSVAGKVSPNFSKANDTKFKKELKKLVSMVKQNIKSHEKLVSSLNKVRNDNDYNDFVLINEENNLYRLKYNYSINDLKTYKKQDVQRVYDNENMFSTLILLSCQLSHITMLKALLNNQRVFVALEVNKNFCSKKSNINSLIKLLSNRHLIEQTKLLIKGSEYEETSGIQALKEKGLKIIINSDRLEEVNNIEFDNNMILLSSKEFIVKYKQELDSKKIIYIKKSIERVYKEENLFYVVLDFMEV